MEKSNYQGTYYKDYLQLDKFLSCQEPLGPCHDEYLFIIVHQAFELWFSQILVELNSLLEIFKQEKVQEFSLGQIVNRLERIVKIQKLFIPYFEILETMTPMDFLEFRDRLIPASGFQSVQFREIEIKLGLKRREIPQTPETDLFLGRFKKEDQDYLKKIQQQTSLIELLELWLERTPFVEKETFNFWKEYQQSVHLMLSKDRKLIEKNATLSESNKEFQLKKLEVTKELFQNLFEGKKPGRLSCKATQNALFIFLYRFEPLLFLPFKFLNTLIDLEKNFTAWRYQHALLAQRMLGTKIGTGGSSGTEYLKEAVEKNKIFEDLIQLSTYLIPKSLLPQLPSDVKKNLGFFFHN